MITNDRWQTFVPRDQLGHIATEILRAKYATNEQTRQTILERAFELIDLTLSDPKWRMNPLLLLVLRADLAKIYVREVSDEWQVTALDKIIAAI